MTDAMDKQSDSSRPDGQSIAIDWLDDPRVRAAADGVGFVLFAKAAYLKCGTVVLMSAHAVQRNDRPTGFFRYLTSLEAWQAGLPVAEAIGEHALSLRAV